MCNEDLRELQRVCVYNLKQAVRVSKTGRLYEHRLEAKGRRKAYKTILRRVMQLQTVPVVASE